MPRKARLDILGLLQHVIIWGIDFNSSHRRVGHLFQNRYKFIVWKSAESDVRDSIYMLFSGSSKIFYFRNGDSPLSLNGSLICKQSGKARRENFAAGTCARDRIGISPKAIKQQRPFGLPVLLTFVVLAALAFVAEAASPPVTIVDDFTRPRTWDGRIDMPYFDEQNQLRWNDALVADAGECTEKRFPEVTMTAARCDRRTVLLSPRVDECCCIGKTTKGVGAAVAYLGIDNSSRERWQRIAQLPNGHRAPKLTGANADGLVFSSFEVWSPDTGETVHPRIATRNYFDTTCYLPKRNAYLQFDAEVSLFHAKGGLFLQTSDGKRELLLPVEKSLTGHYRVESISPVPGTSLILLGEVYLKRGPGSARFTLFDLESAKVLFQDERSEGHYISNVRVIAGPDGHIAFSYLDVSEGKYHVVHYRLQHRP